MSYAVLILNEIFGSSFLVIYLNSVNLCMNSVNPYLNFGNPCTISENSYLNSSNPYPYRILLSHATPTIFPHGSISYACHHTSSPRQRLLCHHTDCLALRQRSDGTFDGDEKPSGETPSTGDGVYIVYDKYEEMSGGDHSEGGTHR